MLYAQSRQYRLSKKKQNHALLREEIKQTSREFKAMTPAGQRMIVTLHTLLEKSEFKPIDRQQIAADLGRPGGLTAWDRRLLRRLEDMDFITCQRQSLPTYQDEMSNATGRGYKLVYTMPIDLAWRLSRLLRSARKQHNNKVQES